MKLQKQPSVGVASVASSGRSWARVAALGALTWVVACSEDQVTVGPGVADAETVGGASLDGTVATDAAVGADALPSGDTAREPDAPPNADGQPSSADKDAAPADDVPVVDPDAAPGQDVPAATDVPPSEDAGAADGLDTTAPDTGTANPDVVAPIDAGPAPDSGPAADAVPGADAVPAVDTVLSGDATSAGDAGPDDAVSNDAGPAADAATPPADTGTPGTDAAAADTGKACAGDGDCAALAGPCVASMCVTGSCATKAKAEGDKCDDGSTCTSGDVCKAGVCAGAAVDCDDGNGCTKDACDPKTGGCSFAASPGGACEDGNLCTDKDTCTASGKCTPGTQAKVCGDGNPCTKDSCEPAKGCVAAAGNEGAACGPGDACQAEAKCAAGKCAPGKKQECDDTNPCTVDSCDGKSGCVWAGAPGPCDDGNKCTAGDACGAGKCKAGTPVDVAKACDDSNACTDDSCDATLGCVNKPNTAPCSDGNECTTGDACADGKCAVPKSVDCDDQNPCTKDTCETKTGQCNWVAQNGACSDGDECTTGEACAGGKCSGGKAIVCDDKNACTKDACDPKAGCGAVNTVDPCDDGIACTTTDACKDGKCAGAALKCDDGNACTDDACEPATGKCAAANNTAACSTGDKCASGDQCEDGKCVAGSKAKCDDASPCTTDKCDPATGQCTFTAVADATPCDDGVACTAASACKTGKCLPSGPCALYAEDFNGCKTPAGWTLDASPNFPTKGVLWKVDALPKVSDEGGCNLNFNDDTDYCDAVAANQCQQPSGNATSSAIDLTKVTVGQPTFSFWTYYDLDGDAEKPHIQLLDAASGAVIEEHQLGTTGGDMKKWKLVTLPASKASGKSVKIRFNLALPSGQLNSGNKGTGWFIDGFSVTVQFVAEVCTNSIDDDGNGSADCADTACKSNAACAEVCDNGKDDNFDGAIDCADPTCAKAVACAATKLAASDFNCGDKDWTNTSTTQTVIWAIDATPTVPLPVTGKCSLNYNNGTNYSPQANAGAAGMATYNTTLDAAGYSQLSAQFWYWLNVESDPNLDRTYLQVSLDDFAGCCGASVSCNSGGGNQLPNNCNTAGTKSWFLSKEGLKTWKKAVIDLKDFASKKFKVRFRFNTIDGSNNAGYSGPFIDDFRIYAGKGG
ncbi:MAG: hypothetical protein EXR79_15500 [Myxococcales bacterium]|nr:hypothetical protein [Myxococcales bacterium]